MIGEREGVRCYCHILVMPAATDGKKIDLVLKNLLLNCLIFLLRETKTEIFTAIYNLTPT